MIQGAAAVTNQAEKNVSRRGVFGVASGAADAKLPASR